MNLHVFRTPTEKKHWSVGGIWISPWRLADDYHVYGFDWGKDELRFYVDLKNLQDALFEVPSGTEC